MTKLLSPTSRLMPLSNGTPANDQITGVLRFPRRVIRNGAHSAMASGTSASGTSRAATLNIPFPIATSIWALCISPAANAPSR